MSFTRRSAKILGIDIKYPTTQPKSNLPTVIFTHGGAHGQAALKLPGAGFCVVSVDC